MTLHLRVPRLLLLPHWVALTWHLYFPLCLPGSPKVLIQEARIAFSRSAFYNYLSSVPNPTGQVAPDLPECLAIVLGDTNIGRDLRCARRLSYSFNQAAVAMNYSEKTEQRPPVAAYSMQVSEPWLIQRSPLLPICLLLTAYKDLLHTRKVFGCSPCSALARCSTVEQ